MTPHTVWWGESLRYREARLARIAGGRVWESPRADTREVRATAEEGLG